MTTDDEILRLKYDFEASITRLRTVFENRYSELKKQCAPPISKKKTIKEIDLGWQKGYIDNCVCLTFMDELTSVMEFDVDSLTSLYDFAPEIRITLNAQKIHSGTLFDIMRMLTEMDYIYGEFSHKNRSIVFHKP